VPIALQKQLSKVSITTPGRVFFASFCAVLAVWFSVGWLFSMSSVLSVERHEVDSWELDAQIRSIERRLKMGEDEILILLIPEGTLFCNSLYGFGLVSLALARENNPEFKSRVLQQLEWLLQRVEKLEQRHPFNLNSKLKPSGGIIIAGHGNLLRAGYALLGGTDKNILATFDSRSKEIYDSFITGKTAFPECYEGHTWAQDSVYALESLRLHDSLCGTAYSTACERWVSSIEKHVDPTTGLMVAQIDPVTDTNIEGPRGCALAWGLSYMPAFAPDFSKSQYESFRTNWFVPFLGCIGIHEWNRGIATPTNFHAGPVIFGLGAAASGIGIAATRANNDYVSWNKLLRSLEFLGIPTINCAREKSYFFNLTLLSDVVAFWGKTIRPWSDQDNSKTSAQSQNISAQSQVDLPVKSADREFDQFLIAIALVSTFCFLLVGSLGFRAWKLARDRQSVRPGWTRATIIVMSVHCACLLLFLLCPVLTWMQILVFMAITDLMEELSIRPGIIGKMYDLEG
jgi:hypothetical protein